MNSFKKAILILFSIFYGAMAIASSHQKDQGKDHPLIDRYPNTYIQRYFTSQYDEFMVATGPIEPLKSKDQLPPVKRYEGKITRILYVAKARDISFLQVKRNYQQAIKKLKAKEIFSCANDTECGTKFITQLYWYGDVKRQRINMYDAPNMHGKKAEYFYWSGSKKVKDKNYIISMIVSQNFSQPVRVMLDINEIDTLDTDQIGVSLDFDTLEKGIENEGKVVLDGILFDTNKVELKSESQAVIKIIADYLKKYPSKKFYVVGHTDSDGDYDFNINLSEGRAASVVKELVNVHSVEALRLKPIGIGPVSPVTSNSEESGKALNRRVELVEM